MPYQRVLPRDLFNESKLLKCLGQVALILHDREGEYPLTIEHEAEEGGGFEIDQEEASGDLYCVNVCLYLRGKKAIYLSTRYNSKLNYPLYWCDEDWNSGLVLYEDGEFSREFIDYIHNQKDKGGRK